MNTSFYLMNIYDPGLSTFYQVEFIIDNDIQSLLTIEIAGDKIQSIDCHPVDQSANIRLIEDTRNGYSTSFIYGGEYFPEDRILYMIGKACDEYDEYIETMTSKPGDEF
jgi:hypothetical protein